MKKRRSETTYLVCCDCDQCHEETGSYVGLGCHVETKKEAMIALKEWRVLEPHKSCYISKITTKPIYPKSKPSKRKAA